MGALEPAFLVGNEPSAQTSDPHSAAFDDVANLSELLVRAKHRQTEMSRGLPSSMVVNVCSGQFRADFRTDLRFSGQVG